jgi:hypothetical protein
MKSKWISKVSVKNGLMKIKEDLRGEEMEDKLVKEKI